MRVPAWVLGLVPLLLIAGGIALFAVLDAPGIGERLGPPAEELAVERTVLEPGIIELTVRNDGPDAVSVAQAVVNDAFAQFTGAEAPIGRLETATVRITQPWVEGEAYEVALVTSTGGTIAHEIPVAVETPVGRRRLLRADGAARHLRRRDPGRARDALAAVAAARPAARGCAALMALTIGLLAFLAVDAAFEGFELAAEGSQAFGGAALVFVGAGVAYLLLSGVSAWLSTPGRRRLGQLARAADRDRHRPAQPRRGRGHRRGLLRRRAGARRVPGHRLRHPQHHRGPRDRRADRAGRARSLGRLALLGLIAGAPAVLGAWIGAGAYNASIAAFLFGFGAGAIIQVDRHAAARRCATTTDGRCIPAAVTGILGGMAVMFLTGLLVAA